MSDSLVVASVRCPFRKLIPAAALAILLPGVNIVISLPSSQCTQVVVVRSVCFLLLVLLFAPAYPCLTHPLTHSPLCAVRVSCCLLAPSLCVLFFSALGVVSFVAGLVWLGWFGLG